MSNVCELFSAVFAYVRQFERQSLHSDFQPPYTEVRSTIARLLEQQDVAARQQGIPEAEYQEARFAVVTWIDETILQYQDWQDHDQWSTFPLQLEYYQTRNAGEEVLMRLEKLPAEQKEMRELYYQCFDLKLIGRYFLDRDDPPQSPTRHTPEQPTSISVLVRGGVEETIPSSTGWGRNGLFATPGRDKASGPAQPEDIQTPAGRSGKQPSARPWHNRWWAGLLGGLLGLLLLALSWPWSSQQERVSAPQLAAPPAPVSPGLQAAVLQWFARQQELLPCSSVTVDAVVPHSGSVHLTGRIASETQRATIQQGLREIPGVRQVSDAFQLIPWPFCDVMGLLEASAESGSAARPAVRLNKAGERPVYYAKENLLVEVENLSTTARYVYIDYYTTDHSVWHVFPNPWESQHHAPPQSTLTVGAINGPSPWGIAPPFGLELVTVVTSATPLFAQPRYGIESAATFLSVLRQAVANTDTEVGAAFSFVVTQEHP